MQYQQYIRQMPADVYERLKRAVELGKWPDGRPLTAEQRRNALQAVIAWDALHRDSAERVGTVAGAAGAGRAPGENCPSALRWVEGDGDGG